MFCNEEMLFFSFSLDFYLFVQMIMLSLFEQEKYLKRKLIYFIDEEYFIEMKFIKNKEMK